MKGRKRKKICYCNKRIRKQNLIPSSNNNSNSNNRKRSIKDLQMKLLIFHMNRK